MKKLSPYVCLFATGHFSVDWARVSHSGPPALFHLIVQPGVAAAKFELFELLYRHFRLYHLDRSTQRAPACSAISSARRPGAAPARGLGPAGAIPPPRSGGPGLDGVAGRLPRRAGRRRARVRGGERGAGRILRIPAVAGRRAAAGRGAARLRARHARGPLSRQRQSARFFSHLKKKRSIRKTCGVPTPLFWG